jgi:hypothetical protein
MQAKDKPKTAGSSQNPSSSADDKQRKDQQAANAADKQKKEQIEKPIKQK